MKIASPYRKNYIMAEIAFLLNMGLGHIHYKERESTSQDRGGYTFKTYGNKGTIPLHYEVNQSLFFYQCGTLTCVVRYTL